MALVNGSFLHYTDMKKFLKNLVLRNRWSDFEMPCPGGSVVSVSDLWPGGCEIDPRLRRLFFSANFRLSPLQKHVRKVVGGFGKKSCVSTGVRKPGNTYASPTAMIWLTLAVKVALNPNTTNQDFEIISQESGFDISRLPDCPIQAVIATGKLPWPFVSPPGK